MTELSDVLTRDGCAPGILDEDEIKLNQSLDTHQNIEVDQNAQPKIGEHVDTGRT